MQAGRAPRRGVSISAKLIVATSLVVAAAVVAAAWFGQRSLSSVTARLVEGRRVAGELAIARETELTARAVVSATALPLAQSTYQDVLPVLEAALADDAVRGVQRLVWLQVTEAGGRVVAAAGPVNIQALAAAEPALAEVADGVARAPVAASTLDWIYGGPIRFGGQRVGALRLGVSTAGLHHQLTAALDEARLHAAHARRRLWIAGGLVVAIGVLLAALQGLGLARPIRGLTRQADAIAAGDLSVRVRADRGDELGQLAGAFNHMADQLGALLAHEASRAGFEKEMELARTVQQAMLPPTTPATYPGVRVVGTSTPASQCGGDWWCHRALAGGRVLVVIGDATGHGVHSAMIAATARGAVEALAASDPDLVDPTRVLRAIDAAICNVGDHGVLMTALAVVLTPGPGGATAVFANAGHNFPFVLRRGAEARIVETHVVTAPGNPLGDRSLAGTIGTGSRPLEDGAVLVLLSDGIVERRNAGGRVFGDRRLRGLLGGRRVATAADLAASRDHVLAEVELFAEGVPADDDQTFVLCQVDRSEGARA